MTERVILKKRLLYIFIICILIVIVIVFLREKQSFEEFIHNEEAVHNIEISNSALNYEIKRIDYSIKNESNETLAYIYYDKPIVQGDNVEACEKINQFFENESEGWFEGNNRLTHNQKSEFEDIKVRMHEEIERYGEETVAVQPFLYVVDTEIIYEDDKYISIRQISNIQLTGKRSWFYYGSTFDKETGELVGFDDFLDVDADKWRNSIVAFLSEGILDYNHNVTLDEIEEIYGPNEEDYKVYIDWNDDKDIELDMNYEYFYDGENIYIILNYYTLLDSGTILKWNGKLDDEFQGQLIGYWKKDDTYELQKYYGTE